MAIHCAQEHLFFHFLWNKYDYTTEIPPPAAVILRLDQVYTTHKNWERSSNPPLTASCRMIFKTKLGCISRYTPVFYTNTRN
jgi:hypothetical protein